jgi:hypothetical protein
MAHIPDLAPISYTRLEGPIRAIGWLEASCPFTRGPVQPEFAQRLMALVARPISAFLSLGIHHCSLCDAEGKCGPDCRTSQAVLLVPAPTCVYEAPIWIGHYVLQHSYQPPQEFCNAVMSAPKPGSDEFCEALGAHLPSLAKLRPEERRDLLSAYIPSLPAHANLPDVSLFVEWYEGAQKTLQADPEYGSKKQLDEKVLEMLRREANSSPVEQHQKDLSFYNNLGSEDPNRLCKKESCGRGAIQHSVFCRSHHFEQMERRECPFHH